MFYLVFAGVLCNSWGSASISHFYRLLLMLFFVWFVVFYSCCHPSLAYSYVWEAVLFPSSLQHLHAWMEGLEATWMNLNSDGLHVIRVFSTLQGIQRCWM